MAVEEMPQKLYIKELLTNYICVTRLQAKLIILRKDQ